MRLERVRRVISLVWPLALAAFFIPFGAHAALAWVVAKGIKGPMFFIIPSVAATADLLFTYWFFKWAGVHIANARKVKDVVNEFKADGWPEVVREDFETAKATVLRIWEWLTDYMEGQVKDHEQPKSRFKRVTRDMFLGFIRKSPPLLIYFIIFTLPAIPIIGMYVGVVVCRAARARLRAALWVLVLGNIGKVCLWGSVAYAALH